MAFKTKKSRSLIFRKRKLDKTFHFNLTDNYLCFLEAESCKRFDLWIPKMCYVQLAKDIDQMLTRSTYSTTLFQNYNKPSGSIINHSIDTSITNSNLLLNG